MTVPFVPGPSSSRQTYVFDARDGLTPAFDNQARGARASTQAMDRLGEQAKRTAGSMTVTEKAAAKLTRELAEQKRKVLELSAAYAMLGDAADKGAKKELAAARSRQSELQKLLKVLTPDPQPRPGPSPGGGRGLFGASLGSPLLAAGIRAGVVYSPFLGAAAGGLLAGAGGLAGVGAGVTSAAMQDAQVRAQFQTVGDEFVAMFREMGQPFREPLKDVAAQWRRDVGQMRSDWVESIGGLAKHVEPLAEGLSKLVQKASPGFQRMLEQAAGPVLDMLASKLPGLGEDLSTFFDSLAAAGPGAAKGIGDFIDVVGDLVVFGGELIEVLAKTYDALDRFAQKAKPVVELLVPLAAALDLMPEEETVNHLKSAGTAMETVAEATQTATMRLQDWNKAVDEAFGEQMNLDEATDAFKRNFLELNEHIKENGRDLRDTTLAGLDNRSMIRDWIEDAKRMRDAAIEMGGGTKEAIEKANGAYERNLDAIRKALIARGYEKKAVEEIIGLYRALAALPNITKTVTIKAVTSGALSPAAPRGQIQFYAEGGPVQRGVPVVVGDAGRPEVFVPGSDGYIHPDARAFASAAGGAPMVIELHQTIVTPDGRTVTESVQRYASQSGQRTLEQLFALPAA